MQAAQCAMHYNRCARFITGRFISKEDDTWIFPDNTKRLELVDLLSIGDCFKNRRGTVLCYAVGTEIYSKCQKSAVFKKLDDKLEWRREKNSVCLDLQNQNSIFDEAEISELGVMPSTLYCWFWCLIVSCQITPCDVSATVKQTVSMWWLKKLLNIVRIVHQGP